MTRTYKKNGMIAIAVNYFHFNEKPGHDDIAFGYEFQTKNSDADILPIIRRVNDLRNSGEISQFTS